MSGTAPGSKWPTARGVLEWLGNVSYRRNAEPLRDMIKRLQGPEQTVSFLERLATSQDLTFPSGE